MVENKLSYDELEKQYQQALETIYAENSIKTPLFPLGTILEENGQTRIVGAFNHEGQPITYRISATRKGKLIIEPQGSGTPSSSDVKKVEPRTMKRKEVVHAFKRGIRRNVKENKLSKKEGKVLVKYIENQWKPSRKARRRNRTR